jgi:hypothetical protein
MQHARERIGVRLRQVVRRMRCPVRDFDEIKRRMECGYRRYISFLRRHGIRIGLAGTGAVENNARPHAVPVRQGGAALHGVPATAYKGIGHFAGSRAIRPLAIDRPR